MKTLNPVGISDWKDYAECLDTKQYSLQKENRIETSICNYPQNIKFIYTETIAELNALLEEKSKELSVINESDWLECEAYYTATIEGASLNRKKTKALHEGAKSRTFSEHMVKNVFAAMDEMKACCQKFTESDLLRIWKILTENCCDNLSVCGPIYRKGNVCVGKYVAPDHTLVPKLMQTYIDFYNSEQLDDYQFIKAAILHYAFESIHPFCDGNGRMGRLLMYGYLLKMGIESVKSVSFSKQIFQRQASYYTALKKSNNPYDDCTPFITYMLEAMVKSYQHTCFVEKEVSS